MFIFNLFFLSKLLFIKKFKNEFIVNVISDIERYEEAVKRNLNAAIPDSLAVKQFQDLRNEMIILLLDYLVENGNKDLLKDYVQNLDVSVAA